MDNNSPASSESSHSTMDQESLEATKWMIVYFPGSEPGWEYEIVNLKDVVRKSKVTLQKGSHVQINCGGNARVSGVIVAMSETHEHLESTFEKSIDEHGKYMKFKMKLKEDKIKRRADKKKRENTSSKESEMEASCSSSESASTHSMGKSPTFSENEPHCSYQLVTKQVVKVKDQETQTEEDRMSEMNRDYLNIKRKYEDMCADYKRFKNLFAEVRNNMDSSLSVFDSFDTLKRKKTSPKVSSSDDEDCDENKENSSNMVTIGSNGTKVERNIFNKIKWSSHSTATKSLLISVFTRDELATHSLTGKPSPAFLKTDKKTKKRLDPGKVNDIIECITKRCMVPEALIRQAITSKCADENKLLRRRQEKDAEEA